MLETRDLGTGYGNLQVVHGVSIAIRKGEMVALVGANGAGKTTTLRAIMGLLPAWEGEVLFDGKPIQGLKTPQIVSLGLAYVPEQKSVFPKMTVMENLDLSLNSREAKQKKEESLAEIFELFPRISSNAKLKQMAGTLSGGEQRMLVLARALMSSPRLILLDEPSLGLAPKLVYDLFVAVEKIHARGVPILLVEQNVTLALQIADRAYVLEQGRIVLQGTGRELAEMPHVREAYLGI
jgi:branched-chain amino acid transport system ATP-binding protein